MFYSFLLKWQRDQTKVFEKGLHIFPHQNTVRAFDSHEFHIFELPSVLADMCTTDGKTGSV